MENTIGGQNYIEVLQMLDYPQDEIMDMKISTAEKMFEIEEAELEGSKYWEDTLSDIHD